LQHHYIDRNPFKVGQKGSLLVAQNGSEYSQFHQQYHPTFKNMIEALPITIYSLSILMVTWFTV